MERKYLQLVQRVGASAEDLEAVELFMANASDKNALKSGQKAQGLAKDRLPSRHEKQRDNTGNNAPGQGDAQYYLFGDKQMQAQ